MTTADYVIALLRLALLVCPLLAAAHLGVPDLLGSDARALLAGGGEQDPPVVIPGGQRSIATPVQQRLDVGHADALVSEHEHQHLAARVHMLECRGDRGGATLTVGLVLHDLDPAQVHPAADIARRAADDSPQLIEGATARGLEHVAQQRSAAVGQKLLGLPQAG